MQLPDQIKRYVNRGFNFDKFPVVLKFDVLFPFNIKDSVTVFQKLSYLQIFIQMQYMLHWSHHSEIRYINEPAYSLEYSYKYFRLYSGTEQSKLTFHHCSSPIGQSG